MGKEHNGAEKLSGSSNDQPVSLEQITAPTSSSTFATVTMSKHGGLVSSRETEAVEAMRQVYNTVCFCVPKHFAFHLVWEQILLLHLKFGQFADLLKFQTVTERTH